MQLTPYFKLMRFDRPIGTLLLLWPTLTALLLTQANTRTYIIFILGVVIMRAAGCVINDYADRNFDLHVQRTQSRPLAQRQISPHNALRLFVFLISLACVLALQLKIYTMYLAGAALLLALIYPLMKRIFNYPQLILGIAFAWSILMVYAEVVGSISFQAWLLFVSTIAWVLAYDTEYAMADKIDDLKIGINSTAISFGDYDKVAVLLLQCLALGLLLCLDANLWFIALAFILVLYQQTLLKSRDPTLCIKAFLNNNYVGACMFLAFIR